MKKRKFIGWIGKNADGYGSASFADGDTLADCRDSIADRILSINWDRYPNGAVVSITDQKGETIESKRYFRPNKGPGTFIAGREDMQWLANVHLSSLGDNWLNGSAILYGNEDCPARIEVYHSAEPLTTDKPLEFILTDNGYRSA